MPLLYLLFVEHQQHGSSWGTNVAHQNIRMDPGDIQQILRPGILLICCFIITRSALPRDPTMRIVES